MAERLPGTGSAQETKHTSEGSSLRHLQVGESITVSDREYTIQRIDSSAQFARQFGLVIAREVPIYWLDNHGQRRQGAFVPSQDIVLFFTNTDRETQHHELTHVVEYFQEKSPGLIALYEEVKHRITEASFEDGFVSFNFRKDIHEFLADGRTKSAFIQALKKEGLHERFQQETAYLFEA